MANPRALTGRAGAAMKKVVGTDPNIVHLIHAVKSEIMGALGLLQTDLNSGFASTSEELSVLGMQMGATEAVSRAHHDEVRALRFELGQLSSIPTLKRLRDNSARIGDIDEFTAYFVNYATSHLGPLADRNLWINHPVIVEWLEGDARIGAVNERIMEVPFVMQALSSVPVGGAVLDIGGGESTLGLSLASLGYRVTVIEPQGYPFTHPDLEVLVHPLEELPPGRRFDAVVLLSTIEHFGIGHYAGEPRADENADLSAMVGVRDLVSPNGLLALTVPYGPAAVNDVERVYDRARLSRLLEGWTIETVRIGRREDATTWVMESDELGEPAGPDRVAMLTARPTTS